MNQEQENKELFNSFLDRTFYEAWRRRKIYGEKGLEPWRSNFSALEIVWNAKCNLKCKYCYIARFGEELYPPELWDEELLMNNLDALLDWIIENEFDPSLEFFSGEPLFQEGAITAIHRILDKLAGHCTGPITIPTNFTFLLNDSKTEKVIKLIERSREVGIPIILSASFDGKIIEENRPFRSAEYMSKEPRDDKYYEKCFALAKKYGFGFHPMIYSENIEKWRDNFLWFQAMFKKHDIPWCNIYLLEVRNAEWTRRQIKDFGDFIEWLVHWSYNFVGRDVEEYKIFLRELKGFNILNSPIGQIGRGMGCSIQSTLTLRLGDLAIVPCHRTMYDQFRAANYVVKDKKIVDINVINPECFLGISATHIQMFPYCEQCVINNLCSGGCLGSQFETTGDLFTPIPTVCALEHEKIWAMIRAYESLGIFQHILELMSEHKVQSFKYMRDLLYRDEKDE